MLEYDVTTVGTYEEIMAPIIANQPFGNAKEKREWEKEYVNGKGDWAVGGESSVDRYKTKEEAYKAFVEDLNSWGGNQLKEFLTKANPNELGELMLGLGGKALGENVEHKQDLIRAIFGNREVLIKYLVQRFPPENVGP